MTPSDWFVAKETRPHGLVYSSTVRRGPALFVFSAFLAAVLLVLVLVAALLPDVLPFAAIILLVAIGAAVLLLSSRLHSARMRLELDADGMTVIAERRRYLAWSDVCQARTTLDKQIELQLRDGSIVRVPPVFDDLRGLLDAIASGLSERFRVPRPVSAAVHRRPAEYHISRIRIAALLFFPVVGVVPAGALNAGFWLVAFLWLLFAIRALNRTVLHMVIDHSTIRITTLRNTWIFPLGAIRDAFIVAIGIERMHAAVRDSADRVSVLPFPQFAVDILHELRLALDAGPRSSAHVAAAHVDPRRRRTMFSTLAAVAVLLALMVPVYTGLALGEAARFGKRGAVHALLQIGAPIEGRGSGGRPPLYQAVKYGREAIVLDLLTRGADPLARERKYGFTALHMAAQENRPRMAEILLAHGVPVDVRNNLQSTPLLHAAIQSGVDNIELAAILLAAGAQPDAKNDEGFAPVHHAAQAANVPLLRYLVSHGATIDLSNAGFGTALSAAARRGRPDLVHELMTLGADIDRIVYSSRSPLGIAVHDGDLATVEALLDLGARTDVQGRDNYTPLHLAIYIGRHDMVRAMLAAGARPSLNTLRMPPPIMLAVQLGDTMMVHLLLDSGASPNTIWNGGTPHRLATETGQLAIAALLRRRGATH